MKTIQFDANITPRGANFHPRAVEKAASTGKPQINACKRHGFQSDIIFIRSGYTSASSFVTTGVPTLSA